MERAQALLSGLYPPGTRGPSASRGLPPPLAINVSQMDRLLPEPEPAQPSAALLEQRALEGAIRQSEAFARKEAAMAPFAARVLRVLVLSGAIASARSLMAPDAAAVPAVAPTEESGPEEGGAEAEGSGGARELAAGLTAAAPRRVHWGRVTELLLCLHAHGLLPLLSGAARAAAALQGVADGAHGEDEGARRAAAKALREALPGWELRGAVGPLPAGVQLPHAAADADAAAAAADASGPPPAELTLTEADVDAAAAHAAWRWFRVLRTPRIAAIAMGTLARELLLAAARARAAAMGAAARGSRTLATGSGAAAAAEGAEGAAAACRSHDDRALCPPKLSLYSGHDATLVGLLSVFRLGAPDRWPRYGAALRLELLVRAGQEGEAAAYGVRFVLGGRVLAQLPGDPADDPYAAGAAAGEEEGPQRASERAGVLLHASSSSDSSSRHGPGSGTADKSGMEAVMPLDALLKAFGLEGEAAAKVVEPAPSDGRAPPGPSGRAGETLAASARDEL